MDHKLSWSPEALEDIEEIASYIGRDSPWYAQIVVTKIIETAQSLREFPESGRMVPEIAKASIRERFVYSYRVIYKTDSNGILVAAVIHGSRLLERLAERIDNTSI